MKFYIKIINTAYNRITFLVVLLFFAEKSHRVRVPQTKPWGISSDGWEGSMCNSFPIPVHSAKVSYIQVQHYPPQWQLQSDFGDFSNEVCHVRKITIAESDPATGLLTQQTFCFSPDILATATELKIQRNPCPSHKLWQNDSIDWHVLQPSLDFNKILAHQKNSNALRLKTKHINDRVKDRFILNKTLNWCKIMTIIMYIYNALNDALSTYRMHNKLKTILSSNIHIQNRQS